MARLNLYADRQVVPAQMPGVSAAAPRAQGGEVMGRQLQQFGQQVEQTSSALGKVGMDLLEQQNTLRVNAAMNQVRQAALDLEYGEQGFRRLKGENAMPDAFDGKPLTEAYLERYQQTVSEVEAGLGNDAQRMAFRQTAGQLGMALRNQTQTYELEQANVYGRSVLTGGASIAAQEAATAYDNPDRVRANIAQIGVLGNELFDRYDGLSGNERTARVQSLQSSAVVDVVKAAADAGDLSLAGRYMEEFDETLTAADRTKLDAIITPAREGQMARQIVENAFAGVNLQGEPVVAGEVDIDRAFEVLIGSESAGRQFNSAGRPLQSNKGATGIAQVMEGTGPEAARLAGLPWDRNRWLNDAAYNRALGRAYFGAQVEKFGGDVRKAWAAYNAGPRWVEGAVSRAEAATPGTPQADWFWQLNNDRRTARNRAETKDYVEKNWRQYGGGEATAGQGVAPTSLREVLVRADALLPADASETLRQRVRQEVTFQYGLIEKEKDQETAETLSTVYKKLAASGGDMSALSASELAAVPGDKLNSVISFADSLAKDGDVESDLGTYYQLSNPQTLRTMSDTAFLQAMARLSETDRRHFAAERAKAQGTAQTGQNSVQNLPSGVIARQVDQVAADLGLRNTAGGEDARRRAVLRRAADQAVLAAQVRKGQPLTEAETVHTISTLFNAPGAVRGMLGGTSSRTERAVEVTYDRIPGDIRRSLTNNLKAYLRRDPTESEVEIEYLRRYSRAW